MQVKQFLLVYVLHNILAFLIIISMVNFSDYIVNISNLKHNLKLVKDKVGVKTKVCAMVKADAYGHGLKDICEGLKGVDFFGVASVYEAMLIRKFDKFTNILIVGTLNKEYVSWCAINNVSVEVSSFNELQNIVSILDGLKLKIHIKVNTGLNRIGVRTIKEFKKILRLFALNSNLILEGVFTHFATKFDDIPFVFKQHKSFMNFVRFVDNSSVIVHCSNSFVSVMFPCFSYGMVRCGFNLYGWQANCGLPFRPVLSILSKIAFIQKVKKGETVGYDRTFVANKNMKIAVVPLGYADGLDRRLSNNFCLVVCGHKARIVGNICMDVCLLDVTDIECEIGSQVLILGENLTPQDYATVLGTSPYEILLKFRYNRMNKILKF